MNDDDLADKYELTDRVLSEMALIGMRYQTGHCQVMNRNIT